jgi:hypothetical protein
LPAADNTSAGLKSLQSANKHYRNALWPAPYDETTHTLHLGDARDLSWIPDNSVHLVVTSPPYWTLKKYEDRKGQLGEVEEYETFLDELVALGDYLDTLPFIVVTHELVGRIPREVGWLHEDVENMRWRWSAEPLIAAAVAKTLRVPLNPPPKLNRKG